MPTRGARADERVVAARLLRARRRLPLLLHRFDRFLRKLAHLPLRHLREELAAHLVGEPEARAQLVEAVPVLVGDRARHAHHLLHRRLVGLAERRLVRALHRGHLEVEEGAELAEPRRLLLVEDARRRARAARLASSLSFSSHTDTEICEVTAAGARGRRAGRAGGLRRAELALDRRRHRLAEERPRRRLVHAGGVDPRGREAAQAGGLRRPLSSTLRSCSASSSRAGTSRGARLRAAAAATPSKSESPPSPPRAPTKAPRSPMPRISRRRG